MKELKEILSTLTQTLQAQHHSIVTAESCTGGLIAGLLTELAGSSTWFERGFVTYSNVAKQEMLGVPLTLLQQWGAVSIPVAEAMALGALQRSRATIALAVTGIAGPSGGSVEKPVGTVCFAFARENMPVQTKQCYFAHASRRHIRLLSCKEALLGVTSFMLS